MQNQELIDLIKQGEHHSALDELYKNYKAFENAFVRSGGKRHNAKDVYQGALLVLIEKISTPDFILTCSVHSYLYGICHNLSKEYFRKKDRYIVNLPVDSENDIDLSGVDEIIERERKYQALDEVLLKIGQKCIDILHLFYHDELQMSTIAEKLGFKSENSAKTQKYKCLEKARSISKKMLVEIQTELS